MNKKQAESSIDFIRLDRNECYYLLNDKIVDELKSFDRSMISIYPEFGKLKKLLANHCGATPEQILVTHGAEQAIRLTIQTFFKKGDEILLLAPIFVAFTLALESMDIEPRIISYKEKDDTFTFPTEELLSSLNSKTKAVLLCNPNNPLGCSIPKNEILEILKKAKELNVLVVIDEVYSAFTGKTSTELTKKYKNLIIIKSFSKEFGMAGLRLGYIIADKKVVDKLDKKREMFWPTNNFAIHTISILLKRKEYFKEQMDGVLKRKEELISLLKTKKIKHYDTDANFIIIKSKNPNRLIENFKSCRILVSDISKYPHGKRLLKNAVRISIPSPEDIIKVKGVIESE